MSAADATAVRAAVLALLALAQSGCQRSENDTPGKGPAKHALLISIESYAERPDLALQGAHADRRLLRSTLVEHLGFSPEHVHELADEEASAAGILRAIDRHLVQGAAPGSEVWVYFAGRGAAQRDRSRRERGGFEVGLVAHDSRSGSRAGSFDLSDDVLRSALRALRRRAQHVTWIVDAGHAAGSTRGGDAAPEARVARTAHEAAQPALWGALPDWVRVLEDDAASGENRGSCVELAASGADEPAWEGEVGADAGARHGFFTWALCTVLRAARPGDSYDVLARRARFATARAAERSGLVQEPRFAGNTERQIGKAGAVDRGSWFDARRRRDDTLGLTAGEVHGLEVGAVLGVRLVGGASLGTARVTELTLGTARACWEKTPGRLPQGPLEACLLAPPERGARIRIRTSDAALARELAVPELVEFVEEALQDPRCLELTRVGELLRVATAEGILLRELPLSSREEQRDALRRFALRERLWRRLWALAERPHAGPLSQLGLDFARPEKAPEDHDPEFAPRLVDADLGGDALAALPSYAEQDRRGEQWLSRLLVRNETRRRVHVHALCLDERRQIIVLSPDRADAAPRTLPSDGSRPAEIDVHVGRPEPREWPLQRAMRERYLVLASLTPIDLTPFWDPELRVATRGVGMPAGLAAQLGLPAAETRSGSAQAWGSRFLELRLGSR